MSFNFEKMATLDQLVTQVQFKSGISNTTTLPTATILTYINYGYQYLIDKVVEVNEDFLEEQKATANLAQNSAYYSLPTDCIKIKQVRIAYSTPTDDTDYNIARELDITAIEDPSYEDDYKESAPFFDITGDHIRLYPIPDSAVTNGLYLYYIARPPDMGSANSGDTVTGIPAAHHELISTYGAKQVCERFELWDKHNRLAKEFAIGVKIMQDNLEIRNLDRRDRMKSLVEIGRRPYVNRRTSDLEW